MPAEKTFRQFMAIPYNLTRFFPFVHPRSPPGENHPLSLGKRFFCLPDTRVYLLQAFLHTSRRETAMVHPSSVAVDYLWECFGKTFFSPSARSFLEAWEKVKKALAHRPFDAESEQYRRFLSQILLNIEELKEKFTYLDVQNEIELCQARLKK